MTTMIDRMASAMANAVIRNDEGEFPRLFDMLDFSGENNAWLVTRGLARAALEALLEPSERMVQACHAVPDEVYCGTNCYTAMIRQAIDEGNEG